MKVLFTLLMTLNVVICYAQLSIPNNYKLLKESPANGNPINQLSFHADNDNIVDHAMIIEKLDEFNNYKLIIWISSSNKQFEVDLFDNWNNEFVIYPIQLSIKKNVLTYGFYSDGTSTYGRFFKLRYNNSIKQFQIIGYDSEYKKSIAKYIDKSYNLITGDFKVVKKSFVLKKTTKTHWGNKPKRLVFIDALNLDLLKKLDAVGNEFEH